MSEDQEVIKHGRPWKYDSFHSTFELADALRSKLLRIWKNDEKHQGMQIKVHFLSSKNQFVVKTRRRPDSESTKKKNVKRIKKNKRTHEGRKFDPQAID